MTKPLFTEAQIDGRLQEIAPQIVADLGPNFLMVPILTGGFIFAADLGRALFAAGADPEVDFLQLSSYGHGRESTGHISLLKDLTAPVSGIPVLLVDDVLDSGRSLHAARELVERRGAAEVKICVAVRKAVARAQPVFADYALFDVDGDAFLVGYGMDDAGGSRAMPVISVVEDD